MANPVPEIVVDPKSYRKEFVKDVMNSDPHKIAEEATLLEATRKMVKFDCGFLVVVDNNSNLVGVITDRDIVILGVAHGKNPETTKVKNVMATNIISCYEDETLEYAADHISENGIRRLVVLNKKDELVGVISIVDMIKHVEDDTINIEVIKHLFKYA